MRSVSQLVFGTAYSLAEGDDVPTFRRRAAHESEYARRQLLRPRGRLPVRLGARWSPTVAPGQGALVTAVVVGSPAYKAGLQSGDRILRFASRKIHDSDDLAGAVAMAQSPANVTVRRQGRAEPVELTVELPAEPVKLGISWRRDEAEPGTIVLTRVIPGTPAAQAGLQVGDRIYRVAGEETPDDQRLARLVNDASKPLILLVERKGRMRTVVVDFNGNTEVVKKAA
jgi:S1-C subfamily serine protease